MPSPRGLGKGLDALFQEKITRDVEKKDTGYVEIDITQIEPNPDQPRKFFSEESIDELSKSIKSQGLLQPILVRPIKGNRYQVVAGERRYTACKKVGFKKVPAIIVDLTDEEALIVALVENLHREDLNCVEEAKALKQIKESLALTQEELSTKVGKSRSHVANSLRLLNLEEEILDGMERGDISAGHGRALLGIDSSEHRIMAYHTILKKRLSVRDVEKIAEYWKRKKHLPSYCNVKGSKKRQDPSQKKIMDNIKSNFQNFFGVSIGIRGSIESGSISIRYSSVSELKAIMKKIGLDDNIGENVSHETMENRKDT